MEYLRNSALENKKWRVIESRVPGLKMPLKSNVSRGTMVVSSMGL